MFLLMVTFGALYSMIARGVRLLSYTTVSHLSFMLLRFIAVSFAINDVGYPFVEIR